MFNDSFFHALETTDGDDGQMNDPFCYTPDELSLQAAAVVQRYISDELQWTAEHEGKMFGVLIVKNAQGKIGFLAAYGGQIEESDEHFFVPPVFDYLQEGGYFKTHEAAISAINREIAEREEDPAFLQTKQELEEVKRAASADLDAYHQMMTEAKKRRETLRQTMLSAEEQQRLIGESQFQKAEYRRKKKAWKEKMDAAQKLVDEKQGTITLLQLRRQHDSEQLQHWLFSQFVFLNGRGESRNLLDIFSQYRSVIPPSGSGECAEPKLLQYAFLHHYEPLKIAMFWWGRSPKGEIRHHLQYYPACQGKCKPILSWMLQGVAVSWHHEDQQTEQLEIIDESDHWVVVNKPAGMLSVPGKGNRPSVLSILRERYPNATGPMIVHRLDEDTSGLMIVAKDEETYHALQRRFLSHQVRKVYLAVLEHEPAVHEGRINLPLMPDLDDRPRQTVDHQYGKPAVTTFRVLRVNEQTGETLVELHPLTGRTHQLRVHCASEEGLNDPIVGDRLYGHRGMDMSHGHRLMLHAATLRISDSLHWHVEPSMRQWDKF